MGHRAQGPSTSLGMTGCEESIGPTSPDNQAQLDASVASHLSQKKRKMGHPAGSRSMGGDNCAYRVPW